MTDVTKMLVRMQTDDPRAPQELLPLIYGDLHRIATRRMAAERTDHTLQATALVHEAYVRLVDTHRIKDWKSRGHFFMAAAEAMRRILIEHARKKARIKRGGEYHRVDVTNLAERQDHYFSGLSADELIDLDAALEKLESEDEMVAILVRLRLYAGLSVTDAAQAMGISRTVAYQHWDYALCWFASELGDE